jgi:hypothetical protein
MQIWIKVMLENSNLIESAKSKEVDKLLLEYQAITAQLSDLETTKKAVLKRLFELVEIGKNETEKHVFNIVQVQSRQTISLAEVKEKERYLYEELANANLIKYGTDYLTVRGIKEKGNRV